MGDDRTPAGYVFASAGYVAPEDNWRDFSKKWIALLVAEGLPDPPELHMRHFLHGQGNFKDWDTGRRERVLGKLIDVINETPAVGQGCVVARGTAEDWEGTHSGHVLSRHHYAMGFPHCVFKLAEKASMFLGAEGKIEFICGKNPQWSPAILRLYEIARVSEEFPFRHRLGEMTFESPKRLPPLQAADLLAYETRRKFIDWKDSSVVVFRRSLVRLESQDRVSYCVHGKEELEPVIEKFVHSPEYRREMEESARMQVKKAERMRRIERQKKRR